MSRVFPKIFTREPLFHLWGCDNEMADSWLWVTGREFIGCYYDRLRLLAGCGAAADRAAAGCRIRLMRLPMGMETVESLRLANNLLFY
jgi:hypothetical protein